MLNGNYNTTIINKLPLVKRNYAIKSEINDEANWKAKPLPIFLEYIELGRTTNLKAVGEKCNLVSTIHLKNQHISSHNAKSVRVKR